MSSLSALTSSWSCLRWSYEPGQRPLRDNLIIVETTKSERAQAVIHLDVETFIAKTVRQASEMGLPALESTATACTQWLSQIHAQSVKIITCESYTDFCRTVNRAKFLKWKPQ